MSRQASDYLSSVSLVALLTAGFVVGSPSSAAAQAVTNPGAVEEIVVTARKRSETLQDVPFSVAAKTEAQLRNSGATNLEDLSFNVASFTVQNLGPGQSQVAMRGISAGQIVRDQPGVKEQVGIYLDESVISLSLFTPDLDLFDLNRVEVLRGPQGTLFGSGSLSGTVRYITNRPNLTDTEVIGEVTAYQIDEGSFDGSVKTAMNFPIAPGKAALRVVGYYTGYGGFIDAVQPDGSTVQNVNDGQRVGGRVSLEIRPNEQLTFLPRIVYQEIETDGFNRIDVFNILGNPFTTTRDPVTLGKREQFTQFEETFTDDFLLADLTIEYDFGGVTLTSVTSYTDREVLQVRDATQLTGSITGQPGVLSADGLPASVFEIDAPLFDGTDVEVFTQEARISSNDEGPLQWVFGVFYSDIERRYGQSLLVDGFEAIANPILNAENPPANPGDPLTFPDGWTGSVLAGVDELFFSDIPYDFEQIAIFGEASYEVTPDLTVAAGIRWFDFEENRILNFDGIFADQTIGQPGRTKSDGVSPRVLISYQANENLQLNAQAAKGFRLGGINDPLNVPLCSDEDLATFGGRPSFGDETLWNYEIGAKSTFMEGRGVFNIAAFYADINDLQATLEAGTCSSRIIFNVPKARSVGVEGELFYRVSENFELGATASYTDAELRSTVTSTDVGGNVTVVGGVEKGNRLPTVPKFQAAATATFTWAAGDFEGFLTGTVQHVGSRFTQIGDQAPGFGTVDLTVIPIGDPSVSTFTFDPKLPDYQLGNIRIGIRADQWELSFFINNLWDERAFLALDRERGSRARVGFLTNQPRTFGVTARGYF